VRVEQSFPGDGSGSREKTEEQLEALRGARGSAVHLRVASMQLKFKPVLTTGSTTATPTVLRELDFSANTVIHETSELSVKHPAALQFLEDPARRERPQVDHRRARQRIDSSRHGPGHAGSIVRRTPHHASSSCRPTTEGNPRGTVPS
jgi:hypothetical protein